MYQPWCKWFSLASCCPYLATFNISPNNKMKANSNDQGTEEELFATSGGQIWLINEAFYPMSSSSEWRQERFGGRKSPRDCGIAHLAIQDDACGQKTIRNAQLKHWREREIDWGLCWERHRWCKKASRRRRYSGSARAARYNECWIHWIDDQRAQNDCWGDDGCYRRQSE